MSRDYNDVYSGSVWSFLAQKYQLIFACLFLMQNLLKAAGATQKQLGLVRLHEQTKKNLEQEIQVRILDTVGTSSFRPGRY